MTAGDLQNRDYVPPQIRICKPIWGLPGDSLAVQQDAVTITNPAGAVLAKAQVSNVDSKGRPLQNKLMGLKGVGPGTVVVLAKDIVNGLDSRYMGPIPVTALQTRMTPLWTK